LKLIDFGFATIIKPEGGEKLMCGTPGYVAPEIYTKAGYNCKVDIFSLGIVLYTVYRFRVRIDLQEIYRLRQENFQSY